MEESSLRHIRLPFASRPHLARLLLLLVFFATCSLWFSSRALLTAILSPALVWSRRQQASSLDHCAGRLVHRPNVRSHFRHAGPHYSQSWLRSSVSGFLLASRARSLSPDRRIPAENQSALRDVRLRRRPSGYEIAPGRRLPAQTFRFSVLLEGLGQLQSGD